MFIYEGKRSVDNMGDGGRDYRCGKDWMWIVGWNWGKVVKEMDGLMWIVLLGGDAID